MSILDNLSFIHPAWPICWPITPGGCAALTAARDPIRGGISKIDLATAALLDAREHQHGAGARLVELVFAPLDKELLGAIRVPMPPFQRILKEVGAIRAPVGLAAAARACLQAEPEADSTHPPLGARLANLRFAEIPPLDRLQTSAIAQLLAPKAVKELAARFDDEWRRKADELVDVGR
jgi:hypothetical protein